MKNRGLLLLGVLTISFLKYMGQAPTCSGNNFYQSGDFSCIWYHPAESPTVSLGGYFILPNNSSGLAIGPNFAMSGPNPTYWTVLNGNYYYYNGTTFVNTGHSSGGSGFINPGAGASYIFNINSSGQVSRYDGTGNASIIATFTDCAGTDAVQDIVADVNDNFYILKVAGSQQLSVYNSSAVPVCSYSMSNCPFGTGLAINRGLIHVLYNGMAAYSGTLQGNTVVFTNSVGLPCGVQNDLACCAADVVLTPWLRAEPDNAIPCLGGTRTLTSDDISGANSYTWSGPGITGSMSSHSVTVNLPGVYTRTVSNCTGLTDVKTFTVIQSSTAPITFYQSSQIKCEDSPPVTLVAAGLANYSWTPSSSLSSGTGSTVLASPGITTSYTVTGQLNGCSGSTIITISAAPIPELYPSASNSSLCAGGTALLSTQMNSLTVTWQPGNLTGQPYPVAPSVTTIYTAQVTNSLGCMRSETVAIEVFQMPELVTQISKEEICLGESSTISINGASDYSLQPGNLSGASHTVSPLANTIYTVTGSNWLCSDSKTLSLMVHPLPVIVLSTSAEEICQGEEVTITASGAGLYSWSSGSTGSQLIFYPFTTSTVQVTGWDNSGCEGSSSIVQKVSLCTSFRDLTDKADILIYPNPGTGTFHIKSNRHGKEVSVRVLNVQGQVVYSGVSNDAEQTIHLSGAEPGLFFIEVTCPGQETFVQKYIVQ